MQFEFSHLLQPLTVAVPAELVRAVPAAPIDLLLGLGNTATSPRSEAAGALEEHGLEAHAALAVLLADADPTAPSQVIDGPGDDWIAELLAEPGDQFVEDLFIQLLPGAGTPAEPVAAPPTAVCELAADIATRNEALAFEGFTMPDDGDRLQEQPAAADCGRAQSRFATPSLDDDLLPAPRKRR